jgi:hypothetical protein
MRIGKRAGDQFGAEKYKNFLAATRRRLSVSKNNDSLFHEYYSDCGNTRISVSPALVQPGKVV